MKKCNICNIKKEFSDFNKKKDTKDGYRNQCRICQNTNRNKEKEKEAYKIWAKKNRNKLNEKSRIYYKIRIKKNLNKKQKALLTKEEKKEKAKLYYNNRMKNDSLFKLSKNIRRNILKSFNRLNLNKNTKTQQILNCSFFELKIHIESLWDSWMSWENYGIYNGTPNYGWDIDHIIPTSFAKNEEELIKLNHYKNLQPLCSYVNRKVKNNKL